MSDDVLHAITMHTTILDDAPIFAKVDLGRLATFGCALHTKVISKKITN